MRFGTKIAAGAAVLAFAIAAFASLGVLPAASQGDGGIADFTWTMPDRFGHHALAERRLYPQSPAEVDSGPFGVDVALDGAACEPGISRRFSVSGTETSAVPEGNCTFRLTFLREGAYEVEVRVQGNGHDATSSERVVVQDLLVVSIGDSVASGEGNPDSRSFAKPFWQNRRCHRSALAGTAKAAAAVEARDPKSSVTFVHLACSGATVPEGLTGRYTGAQPSLTERFRKLDPQLSQLEEIAGKRELDAVLLSVGANDVGFAAVVTFCLTHASCPDKRIKPKKLGLPGRRKRLLREAMIASLAQLPQRYANVREGLPDDLDADRVYAVEYFDSTHADGDTLCASILATIDAGEVRWAHDEVLDPLNSRLHAATRDHGWTYVPGVARAFAAHGHCTGQARWVRRLDESLWQQGFNHKGTLHPNEAGHAATAGRIDAALRRDLFAGGEVREPRSPDSQDDIALAATGVVPAALAEPVSDETAEPGDDGDDLDLGDPVALALLGVLVLGLAGGAWALLRNRAAPPAKRVRGDRAAVFLTGAARVWGPLAILAVGVGLALEDEPDAGRAGVLAALVVLAVLLLLLRPADLRSMAMRVKHVKAGPVEATLAPAEEAAEHAEPEEPDKDEPPLRAAHDMLGLRLKLEAKLAYIAKLLLAERIPEPTDDDPEKVRLEPTFVTIGSLRHDGYLTENEATVADQILTRTDGDLASLPEGDRVAFIELADQVVGGIRAGVFRSMVRKRLTDAGRQIRDDVFPASLGGRPDLEVTAGGRTFRVVPVFAVQSESKLLGRARERLTAADDPPLEQRILVVPDLARSPSVSDHPRVVKLEELTGALPT